MKTTIDTPAKTRLGQYSTNKSPKRNELVRLREEACLTQAEVAEALDTTRSAVCHWEKGRARVGARHRKPLLSLYGIEPSRKNIRRYFSAAPAREAARA